MLQEIFLQPDGGEAGTPRAGKRRNKCLGEGKGDDAPSWKASWKTERLGCRDHIPWDMSPSCTFLSVEGGQLWIQAP